MYPAPLRDLLIELAASGLFRARWTEHIHEEWVTNLLAKRPDLSRDALDRTVRLMNEAVLGCLVSGYKKLIPALMLPDANDRHILAAAIRGRCDSIITFNLGHFPEDVLTEFDIEAQHPDEFIIRLFDLDNGASVIAAARACRTRLRNPAKTAEEYLGILRRQSLSETVARLEPHMDAI